MNVSPLSCASVTMSPLIVNVPPPDELSIGLVCVEVNRPLRKVMVKSPQFPSLTVPGSSRNGEELSSAFVKLVFHFTSTADGPLFGEALGADWGHGARTSGASTGPRSARTAS